MSNLEREPRDLTTEARLLDIYSTNEQLLEAYDSIRLKYRESINYFKELGLESVSLEYPQAEQDDLLSAMDVVQMFDQDRAIDLSNRIFDEYDHRGIEVIDVAVVKMETLSQERLDDALGLWEKLFSHISLGDASRQAITVQHILDTLPEETANRIKQQT